MSEVVRVREDRLGRTHSGEVVAPLSAAGEPFYFSLAYDGFRYYADSAQALLPVLIAGYPSLPAVSGTSELPALVEDENSDGRGERRLQVRMRHARATRSWLAAERLVGAEERSGLVDPQVRTLVLAPTPELPGGGPWTHQVPLVLVDLDFRPHGHRPCPSGNVLWLRPATADGYLRSLAAAGAIALAHRP